MSEQGKRVNEEKARRRRRGDSSYENSGRLGVDTALLDRENFAYRWINDAGGRLQYMTTQQDWDIVKDTRVKDEGGKNEGAQVRQIVGANKDGSPMYAYLCREPKEFFKEDQARKNKRLDEEHEAMLRGEVRGENTLTASDPNAYVPAEGISIRGEAGRRKGAETYTP